MRRRSWVIQSYLGIGLDPLLWGGLIEQNHREVDELRAAKGLPAWDWGNRNGMKFCTQCGVGGRPVEAVGVDEDDNPACSGHSIAQTSVCEKCGKSFIPSNNASGRFCSRACYEAKSPVQQSPSAPSPELCSCGRPYRHRGRCRGTKLSKPDDSGFRTVVDNNDDGDDALRQQAIALYRAIGYKGQVGRKMGVSSSVITRLLKGFWVDEDGVLTYNGDPYTGEVQVASKTSPQTTKTTETSITVRHREPPAPVPAQVSIVPANRQFIVERDIKFSFSRHTALTKVTLTPEIVQAVWKSLTREQKFDLMDVEGLWDSFDYDMQAGVIHRVLLIYPEDEKLDERNGEDTVAVHR